MSERKEPARCPFTGKIAKGGELHQQASSPDERLTTGQGLPVSDDQNSLKFGDRGPTLLEDFILREKITHFDHERIPERVVHARGYGAHGYFQSYDCHEDITKASFLQDPEEKTEVFVRFSTVAGSEGSLDTARDVRGFSVKFYTKEGNYDLVGNNMPVFFIQDAIKFPDLIHSVKPEPDRGFPQAQSAHDTFWDFVSLTPESVHMLLWIMSDRAIPRSYRMMEGFGVHTFRMINQSGESRFVKFHWRPKLGTFSLIWDEAVKLGGADPDFHRRDLWQAIESGDFPEWELCVQVFTEEEAAAFDFDVLDPTKLVPEEKVPLRPLGKMVLNRNVDNFFAETEQVAFCPSHVVPGIDFSDDPLLQGRLFSYLDTQISRLGSPNFNQLPVNAPKCPMRFFQRDAQMQTQVPSGRVANQPNSLDEGSPRECPVTGFSSFPKSGQGEKRRSRSETFADYYSQARLFWKSMTEPERNHIVGGFTFELGKCEARHVRKRMLGHLMLVDQELGEKVASALGMEGEAAEIEPVVPIIEYEPSPALSQYSKSPASLQGKKIGVLTSDGTPASILEKVLEIAKSEGATVEVVAPKAGRCRLSDGKDLEPDHFLAGGPSMLFDCVVVAPGGEEEGGKALQDQADAVDWIRNAFGHLKVIGFSDAAEALLEKAGVEPDVKGGVIPFEKEGWDGFIEQAKKHRVWQRESKVRPV